EAGIVPPLGVGISVGGLKVAVILGNSPGQQVGRLWGFLRRGLSHAPLITPPWFVPVRPLLNQMTRTAALMRGVPDFFRPPRPPPAFYIPNEKPGDLGYYDTEPLRRTLEELVDFDVINRKQVRLSLGTVNLKVGKSLYFDNHETRIGPDHVRASGALPPGLPPVEADGEYYWDGGIVCNSP